MVEYGKLKREIEIDHMASSGGNFLVPIISKMYCSSSQVVLCVRRRPHVPGGGGLVVMDCSQRVVFKVDGCGIIGKQGELIIRDGQGEPILLIRQKVSTCMFINIIVVIYILIYPWFNRFKELVIYIVELNTQY